MPHVDHDDGLPKTPPRPQGTIPKPAASNQKAKTGLLGTLSMFDYQPDPKKIDEALGLSQHTEVPFGSKPDLRVQRPQ
jgi:hypothetical protein